MGRLDGKVVVVTGASRGIGAEIARLFAAEGGRVVCAARTLREGDHPLAGSLETTVAEIRAAGGEAHAVAANIAEPAECERLIDAAREAYGPVDVLVNNAALTYFIPVQDYPREQVAPLVGGERARAVLPEPARARGHDPAPERGDREHLLGLGDRPRPRAVHGPGAACAAAPATAPRRPRSSASRRAWPPRCIRTGSRSLAVAVAGRADAGHRAPQARARPRRPARRAARSSWRRRRCCSPREPRREGQRARDLQPADPEGVRLDHRGARPRRRPRAAAATRRSEERFDGDRLPSSDPGPARHARGAAHASAARPKRGHRVAVGERSRRLPADGERRAIRAGASRTRPTSRISSRSPCSPRPRWSPSARGSARRCSSSATAIRW